MIQIRQDPEWWDEEFRSRKWDLLKATQELPRYGVLYAYMKDLGRAISLLDVGCGEGLILNLCEREWLAKYWGLDLSQTALNNIQGVLPNDRLVCSPLESFTTEEKFDVILFNEVLYYTAEPESHLERFRNYLNRGGVFLISMHQKSGWFSYNNRCIRSVWRFIRKAGWKTIDEVLIRNIPHKASWKIVLIQP